MFHPGQVSRRHPVIAIEVWNLIPTIQLQQLSTLVMFGFHERSPEPVGNIPEMQHGAGRQDTTAHAWSSPPSSAPSYRRYPHLQSRFRRSNPVSDSPERSRVAHECAARLAAWLGTAHQRHQWLFASLLVEFSVVDAAWFRRPCHVFGVHRTVEIDLPPVHPFLASVLGHVLFGGSSGWPEFASRRSVGPQMLWDLK